MFVSLQDLRYLVEDLSSERFSKVITTKDAKLIGTVVSCIASTLHETNVRVSPNEHMLRASEAKALAGYLRSRYRGRAKLAAVDRKRAAAVAYTNERDELIRSGSKATEAQVNALVELNDDYLVTVRADCLSQELAEHLDSLSYAIHVRLEVLIEISRNERALSRGTEES